MCFSNDEAWPNGSLMKQSVFSILMSIILKFHFVSNSFDQFEASLNSEWLEGSNVTVSLSMSLSLKEQNPLIWNYQLPLHWWWQVACQSSQPMIYQHWSHDRFQSQWRQPSWTVLEVSWRWQLIFIGHIVMFSSALLTSHNGGVHRVDWIQFYGAWSTIEWQPRGVLIWSASGRPPTHRVSLLQLIVS